MISIAPRAASAATCPHCKDHIEELEERIRQLSALALGKTLAPPAIWRLTPSEAVVIRLLAQRERVTVDTYFAAMEDAKYDYDAAPAIFRVFVCKIRKKLAPFGVEIIQHYSA